ncbi:MAG: hypothetical protein Q9M50_02005 [Methylococcales bacterium]|nr:hypothetical protein [Methylococcales bacterium]
MIEGGVNVTADDLKNTLIIADSEKEQTVLTKGGEDLITIGKGKHKLHGGQIKMQLNLKAKKVIIKLPMKLQK